MDKSIIYIEKTMKFTNQIKLWTQLSIYFLGSYLQSTTSPPKTSSTIYKF